VLLALLVALPASLLPAQAAPRAEVAATVADGFARFVFTLPPGNEADVKLESGVVIVHFKQPLDINIDRLALSAPDYVAVARADPDGTGVRIALKRKVRVNAMAAGERFFVDLLPEGWAGLPPGLPRAVIEDLSRRALVAERLVHLQKRPQAEAPPPRSSTIRLRVASLPTFTRYTFDLPGLVAVTTSRDRDKLTLVFDAPLKFDLADARAALPPTVATVEGEAGDTSATVRFSLAGKVDVRTFREDLAFVLDVTPSAADEGVPPIKVSGERSARLGELPPSPLTRPMVPAPAIAAPTKAAEPPPRAPAPKPQAAVVEPPGRDLAKHAAPPRAQPRVAESVGAEPSQAAAAAQPAAGGPVTALAKREGETLRLVFPFHAATAAAAFRRGDTLWLVFDSAVPLDTHGLAKEAEIRSVSVTKSGEGQVVRIKLARPRLTSMAAEAESWAVTLGDTVLEPTAPLAVARSDNGASNASAAIAFQDPRHVHAVTDPEFGDKLFVVTGFAPARGFLKAQNFVEFAALPSTHGVVIEAIADDIAVNTAPERIVVTRPGGLAMSPTPDSVLAAESSQALDAKTWKSDRTADFFNRQATLIRAAAGAPERQRNSARVALARFYVACDMFAEAAGVLNTVVASERSDSADLANATMLRGIAELRMGRDDQAYKDLMNSLVGKQPDIQLWRGMVLSRLGRFAQARENLKNVETSATGMPLDLQRLAIKEAARADIEVGDFADAARRLNDFDGIGVPDDLKPSLALLSGRVAEGLGRINDALGAYRAAAASTDRLAAAYGQLHVLLLRSKLKQIPRAQAIGELETLSIAWRGDDVELQALAALARLYIAEGRYRDAFQAMSVALKERPLSELTRKIQKEAAVAFDAVFLGGKGDNLTPVEALGLFYDFRTLTPPGRRGDEMIRRLSERLIGMDLLSQAEELLQHQVDHRLQGAMRAQVAARLSTVYLMDHKPEPALLALRSTRMADLPNDLRQQRLLLEARALSDAGRFELALELTEDLPGRETQRLRADIEWHAKHWQQAAEQIERILGERWRDPALLDAAERVDVLRAAVGYALADDAIGRDRFRDKYAAKMAKSSDRRIFEVVSAPTAERGPEFAELARKASSADTLTAFLRDLRARFPDPADTVSSVSRMPRG
jgi:tetratricopeptide (TPR) repeat protein